MIKQLSSLPPKPIVKKPKDRPGRDQRSAQGATRFRRWQLVVGGIFLMLFGLLLGVMLTKSVRTRGGENDTMTGDFLTGTTPANGEARAALSEGKTAFAHQEFPKAIEAFKKVLAADPNNPEAHSYMGFILVEAGHADGALLAFDRALSQAPNFPMALWGKGLVLYREKKDFAGAREALEKVLNLVPPGEEMRSPSCSPRFRQAAIKKARHPPLDRTPLPHHHHPLKSPARSPSIQNSKPTSIPTRHYSLSPAPPAARLAHPSPLKKSTAPLSRSITHWVKRTS